MERPKNAVIFHGTNEGPESFWIPYVKSGLERRGFGVVTPQLYNPGDEERTRLEMWLPDALSSLQANIDLLIAHSAGVPLALSVLERLTNASIKYAVLVAGFCSPRQIDKEFEEFWGEKNPMLQEKYDWDRIKIKVGRVTCLNSDNDPYGCGIEKGQELVDLFGRDKAELLVRKGQGHMGSREYKQPYLEFPLLLKLVDQAEI